MKICTLIVRLVGIFLFVRCSIALSEVHSMRAAMQARFEGLSVSGLDPGGQLTSMQVYIKLGILAGLLCVVFAPFVARVLTFDAPRDTPAEPGAAHEPPPADAARTDTVNMNRKPESEAPAESGGR
jgi:hypothetical protein